MTTSKKINIAIDGYSGTGKSSTAKAVATRLGYTHLDSGAMYRSVALYLLQNDIDMYNEERVFEALKNIEINFMYNGDFDRYETYMNGENVEAEIRGMKVSGYVSGVSAIRVVRQAMVGIQRQLGESKGVVMDGRDIGTVVFPNAGLKIFMTADIETRARRRQLELEQKGIPVELSEVIKNLDERDLEDSAREMSPLKKASDAIEIDTTELSFEDQVEHIVAKARQTIDS